MGVLSSVRWFLRNRKYSFCKGIRWIFWFTLIFVRCHYSWSAKTPVKYERDIHLVTSVFIPLERATLAEQRKIVSNLHSKIESMLAEPWIHFTNSIWAHDPNLVKILVVPTSQIINQSFINACFSNGADECLRNILSRRRPRKVSKPRDC